SEAVLIYLEAPQAEQVLSNLSERFDGAELVMDITPTRAIALQPKSALMKVMDRSSWFRWACDDVHALERVGARVEQEVSLTNLPADIRRDLTPMMRTVMTLMPAFLMRWMSGGYGIYRFRLSTRSVA
ncbi:MAG: hypothetical protein AAF728_18450, partial [Cyanobacteria bacterium P01_D01_bin.128]